MPKRRADGDGGVYQRADGLWEGSISLGIVNGKRKRKSVYGKTRKEALDKLKALQRQSEQGVDLSRTQPTLAAFLSVWLDQAIKPHRKARTYESYRYTVEHYITPDLGTLQLTQLTGPRVQSWINDLIAVDHPRTTQYARAVLSRALNKAVAWGYIARNPVLVTDAPVVVKQPIIYLTEAQARMLLDAVIGHRLEALYRVALALGLRKGEIVALLWSNIDWKAGTLTISGTTARIAGKLQTTTPKTIGSGTTIPLPATLLLALRAHQQYQREERALKGDEWREHGLIFPSEIGTPLEPRNLTRHFKGVLKQAGLPLGVRFHDLRHSCAALLIAQGVHMRVVMQVLRHQQISTTMNIYGHVYEESQRDAVAGVDALFQRKA